MIVSAVGRDSIATTDFASARCARRNFVANIPPTRLATPMNVSEWWNVCLWPFATFRGNATIWTLSEAKRTFSELRL